MLRQLAPELVRHGSPRPAAGVVRGRCLLERRAGTAVGPSPSISPPPVGVAETVRRAGFDSKSAAQAELAQLLQRDR